MKALIFNIYGSLIDMAYDSISLRASYMLSDHTVSAGTTGNEIYFEEEFKPATLELKVTIMNRYWGAKGEKTYDLDELKRLHKALKQIKHMNTRGIVVQKQMERAVDNLFAFCKQEMLEDLQKKGLPQLRPLCDGATFGFYTIHPEHPEKVIAPGYFKASEIMCLQFPEEDKEEGRGLFVVPPSFMLYEQDTLKRKIFSARDKEASDTGNIYLENCIKFPNINILNAVELKAIREYLEQVTVPFRKAVDEWTRLCEEETDGNKSVQHFKQEVRIRAAEVAARVKENEVLQHYDRLLNFDAVTNLWMGEVPAVTLLEFYREGKVIKDETWEALMKIKDSGKFEHKRWPVMAIEVPGLQEHIAANKQKTEMTTVAPVKKSLSMD